MNLSMREVKPCITYFYNQLAGWREFEETVERANAMEDAINDYYECLIECDDDRFYLQEDLQTDSTIRYRLKLI